MTDAPRRPARLDYDEDPQRFRTARAVIARHGLAVDVHERVARRLLAERATPVLDVGCGEGELARHLPHGEWVGVDSSATMLANAPSAAVHGEATALPFDDASFGSVALLYVLYHLEEPGRALAEARRVLAPGGLVVAAAPSRHDAPELAHALPRRSWTFDAEIAPALVADYFTAVEVEAWDAPLLELPSRDAVRDFLVGKGTARQTAEREADAATVPLTVTKRGALVYARRP